MCFLKCLRCLGRFLPWRRLVSLKRFAILGSFLVVVLSISLILQSAWNKPMSLADLVRLQGILPMESWSGRIHRSKAGSTKNNRNQGFSHLRPRKIKLANPEPISHYVFTNGSTPCLKQGTQTVTQDQCKCHKGWFGESCNTPESIHFSNQLTTKDFIQFRSFARRIIYAAPFNHEFVMLEAVLNDLFDLVDVFIFVESPYTAYGVRKPVRLLPRLHRGYLKKFHSKIIYLYIDHFPVDGRAKGWIADSYIRSYLGRIGMPFIQNTKSDDLFLVFDMDEIPSRDSLIFLKVHDGYGEPFGFRLRWSAFGYFWKHRHYSQIPAGCTVGLLKGVYHDDSNLVRDSHHGVAKTKRQEFIDYRRNNLIHSWFLGEETHFAGWHCSSCFHPQGIRIKFRSAQNADWPRWGSIHDKMDLKFIEKMVKEGKWFDGSPLNNRQVSKMADPEKDPFYAPPYLMKNYDKFKYLLENPYLDEDEDQNESKESLGVSIHLTSGITRRIVYCTYYVILCYWMLRTRSYTG